MKKEPSEDLAIGIEGSLPSGLSEVQRLSKARSRM